MTDLIEATRRKQDAWRELPFVRHREGEEGGEGETSNWVVPRLAKATDGEDESLKVCLLENILGKMFAIELLSHVADHPEILPEYLGIVVETMVRSGAWGYVEIGFFEVMDQFIATGEVSLEAWTASKKSLKTNPGGAPGVPREEQGPSQIWLSP